MADDPKKRIKDVNEELGYLEDQLISIADKLSNTIKNAIEDIRDESEGVAKIFEKKLTRDIKSLAKDSDSFLRNTQKLRDGTAKVADIQKQIKDNELKQLSILRSITILKNQGVLTEDQVKQKIDEINLAHKVQNELLADQLVKAAQLEEKLGLTGKIIKGISKIPLLNNIVDTKKALEAAAQSSTKIGAMGAALKSIGKDVLKNITDPLTIATFTIGALYKTLIDIDKKSGEFAKSMNMTYSDSVVLRAEFKKIGDATNDAFVNSRSMSESLMAVNSALGTSVRLSNEELVIFTKLREEAGYTNEELVEIQKLTLATGGTLEGNVKKFAGTVQLLNAQNKLSINEKQLLKDISKVSDSIKLSVGGTAEAIATAAFKAKQFGINLQQADQISQKLLNFEESISDQISAELLTGKELNLERARLLALNGNIADASAEILEQVGGTAEFSAMNRIQQEAIAKAVGLSRDDLAKSLIEREALVKLGTQEGTLQEQYNKLKEDGLTQEQIAAKLGDASLAKQLEQTSNAEKLQASVEKLKEAFIPIAESILPKINKGLDWFSKNVSLIKDIILAIGAFLATKMVASFTLNAIQAGIIAESSAATAIAQQLTNQALVRSAIAAGTLAAEEGAAAIAASEGAIASLTTASALTGGLGLAPILLGLAAAAAAFFAFKSSAKVEDGTISNSGLVVGKYNKGQIQPIAQGSADDNVIFTTNKPQQAPQSTAAANVNIDNLIREQQRTNDLLNRMNSKSGNNYFDTYKVGIAESMGTYRV